eukprot:6062030-Amphidinium_carterae.3
MSNKAHNKCNQPATPSNEATNPSNRPVKLLSNQPTNQQTQDNKPRNPPSNQPTNKPNNQQTNPTTHMWRLLPLPSRCKKQTAMIISVQWARHTQLDAVLLNLGCDALTS